VTREAKCIWTIGHSTRSPEEMIRLLHLNGIRVVVDVRRFPKSTKSPHFNSEAIATWLAEAGIKYVWLGDKLGGYRQGGYECYMSTEGFACGLRQLEELAKETSVAIMCAERFPWMCHRRFIASSLISRGWRVLHIIDEKRVWEQKQKIAP